MLYHLHLFVIIVYHQWYCSILVTQHITFVYYYLDTYPGHSINVCGTISCIYIINFIQSEWQYAHMVIGNIG